MDPGSQQRHKQKKEKLQRSVKNCPWKGSKGTEGTSKFPKPCYVDDSKVFWLPPGEEYFRPDTYPPPRKIKNVSFKSQKNCKQNCAKIRGKQVYVNYNCVWPFLFYSQELHVISKQLGGPVSNPGPVPEDNVYLNTKSDKEIKERLKLPFYKERHDPNAGVNTLAYMFFKMRSGIYVKIRDNKLAAFVPFFNVDYKNDWTKDLTSNIENAEEWLQNRLQRTSFKAERLPDVKTWEAHGCLVFNWVLDRFSDRYIAPIADMFRHLCKERKLPDVEFFVNKNDFPFLKKDRTQPNPYVYEPKPLKRFRFKRFMPILSNCTTDEFADIPIPTPDDWMRVTREYFPASCDNPYSLHPKKIPWKKKIPTAIFRGASTGCGDTIDTNPRLKAASLSLKWHNSPLYDKANEIDGVPFLNAGITRVTPQDTVLSNDKVGHIFTRSGKIPVIKPIPLFKQSRYKYQLDIEGYAAAFRLGYLMGMGSVVLKVDSPYRLWFSRELKPVQNYIPVTRDLSDLNHVIAWCKLHDKTCHHIAENARRFQRHYLNRKGLLDYLQLVLYRIAEKN